MEIPGSPWTFRDGYLFSIFSIASRSDCSSLRKHFLMFRHQFLLLFLQEFHTCFRVL